MLSRRSDGTLGAELQPAMNFFEDFLEISWGFPEHGSGRRSRVDLFGRPYSFGAASLLRPNALLRGSKRRARRSIRQGTPPGAAPPARAVTSP
jgi:hypothetical protein